MTCILATICAISECLGSDKSAGRLLQSEVRVIQEVTCKTWLPCMLICDTPLHVAKNLSYTCFFYKNTLYKNVQDEIGRKVKKVLRILPSLRIMSSKFILSEFILCYRCFFCNYQFLDIISLVFVT